MSRKCEDCGVEVTKAKAQFLKLPHVLVLQLKRLHMDCDVPCTKVTAPVKFTPRLDVGTTSFFSRVIHACISFCPQNVPSPFFPFSRHKYEEINVPQILPLGTVCVGNMYPLVDLGVTVLPRLKIFVFLSFSSPHLQDHGVLQTNRSSGVPLVTMSRTLKEKNRWHPPVLHRMGSVLSVKEISTVNPKSCMLR